MRDRLTRAKLMQIIIVLLILVAAFWWRTVKNDEQGTDLALSKADICDISHKKCTLNAGNLTASAQLSSKDLQAEVPFSLSLELSDPQAKVLKSRIEGHTMYMGTLPAMIKETQPGQWKGQALVGSCTERSMIWAWVVDVEQVGDTEQFKFLFEVTR